MFLICLWLSSLYFTTNNMEQKSDHKCLEDLFLGFEFPDPKKIVNDIGALWV